MPAAVRDSTIATGVTSATVARPAVMEGEPLLAFVWGDEGTSGMSAPSGWTSTATVSGIVSARVWRKTAGSSEPSSYNFGLGFGAFGGVIIASISGRDPAVDFRIATSTSTSIGDGAGTPGVTPAAAQHLELRFVAAFALEPVSFSAPPGYTMRRQGAAAEISIAALASRHINSSANSGPKTFPAGGGGEFGILDAVGVTISIPSLVTVAPTLPPIPAITPGRGDSLYQYVASDFLSGTYLGHLDLTGVTFSHRISRRGQINAGDFRASLPINSPAAGRLAAAVINHDPTDLARKPGAIRVEIFRDGTAYGRYWIVGGRLAQTRRSTPVLEISGLSYEAYPLQVELQEDLGDLEDDRVEIARQLLAHMQGLPGANIGLALQGGNLGDTITRTYLADDMKKHGELIAELTEGLSGFEWHIDPAGNWKWGAPLGDPDAGHYFSQAPEGGDILDWEIQWVPLQAGTRWRARGESVQDDASTAAVPPTSTVYEATAHLAAGWPRIDRTIDRPGISDIGVLDDYAEQWAATLSGAPQISAFTVLIGQNPTLTPFNLGDSASFVLTNEAFPAPPGGGPGYAARHRVIGMEITPVGREQGKDEMRLIIAAPEEIEG